MMDDTMERRVELVRHRTFEVTQHQGRAIRIREPAGSFKWSAGDPVTDLVRSILREGGYHAVHPFEHEDGP